MRSFDYEHAPAGDIVVFGFGIRHSGEFDDFIPDLPGRRVYKIGEDNKILRNISCPVPVWIDLIVGVKLFVCGLPFFPTFLGSQGIDHGPIHEPIGGDEGWLDGGFIWEISGE